MKKKKKAPSSKAITPQPPKNFNEKLIKAGLFLLAFLLYANTLGHQFALDDDVYYLKHNYVQQGISGLGDIFSHGSVYGFNGSTGSQPYRPMTLSAFAIQKELFDNDPFWAHLVNVLIFAFTCVLLYIFLKRLLIKQNKYIPLIAAVLFAAHPIHTEVVANVKSLDEILSLIFLLPALIFLLKFIDEKNNSSLAYSGIFFLLSILSKETAVTFLLIIPLMLYVFRNISLKKIAVATIPYAGIILLFLIIREAVMEPAVNPDPMLIENNALAAASGFSEMLATKAKFLIYYIWLLIVPHPLSWDYGYNQISIVNMSDPAGFLSVAAVAALLIFSLAAIKSKNKYAFGILFFFISMALTANIFFMIGATIAERFLYIPSIAFCLAVAVALVQLAKKYVKQPDFRTAVGSVAIILLLLYSYKTVSRNQVWESNKTLFTSGVETAPNSIRTNGALGDYYRKLGEDAANPQQKFDYFKLSLPYYYKTLQIHNDLDDSHYHIGLMYYYMGMKDSADKYYTNTLEINPKYTAALNNKGVLLFEENKIDSALPYFLKAIETDPNHSNALANIGVSYHKQGALQKAEEYYHKAIAANPKEFNAYRNLIKLYESTGNMQQRDRYAQLLNQAQLQ